MTDRLHSLTLADVARDNARNFPTMEAFVCGGDRWSYAEFDERTNRFAQALRSMGIEASDCVVWIGYNCHRLFELIVACAKVGAVAVPVNWRLSAAEVAQILGDLKPRAILTSRSEEFSGVGDVVRDQWSRAPLLVHDEASFEERLASSDPIDPEGDDDDELPVLGIMTAAFDGRAKGALLTSRGIVVQNLVLASVGIVEPGTERYLCAGPMFHIGVLLKAFAIFHWGGANVVLPRTDALETCRLVAEESCTSAYVFAPTMVEMVEANRDAEYDLRSLRDTVGGAPPDEIADEWYGMTSCRPPEHRTTVGYGTTETVGMVTFEGRPPRGVSAFGRPSPAVSLRIVAPDGHEVAPGELGEIVVRGPQVMWGYRGQLPPDPDGWRHMGDLGRREEDGSVTFVGPGQDMIKTGMENVYPAEVEAVLREHPSIAEVCVFGIPDEEWGQSITAAVELRPDEPAPGEHELVDFVRQHIASYKKPRSIHFVDELPKSGPFVDRESVKARFGGDEVSW